MFALIIIKTLNIKTTNDVLCHSMHLQTLQCYLHIYQIHPNTLNISTT